MSTLVAQTISNGTVSTSSANVIQGSAKAWASFAGVNGAVTASYNVSSVTRRSAGRYTVNLTNAMPNANYSIFGWGYGSATQGTSNVLTCGDEQVAQSTGAYSFLAFNLVGTAVDQDRLFTAIFA